VIGNSDLVGISSEIFDDLLWISESSFRINNPICFKQVIVKGPVQSFYCLVIVLRSALIYAIFMAISARLLKENGELIFITPRSYASGSYFKLFREYFFKIIEIDNVHLFVSRKDTFNRDKVLQETVIIKRTRKKRQTQSTMSLFLHRKD
jgi:adenine-specific DNA-methyltransferase